MGDKPFDVPLRLVAGLAGLLLTALRLVLAIVLRVVRPFIVLPLLLVIVGGIGAGLVFGYGHHWQDAARAVFVSVGSAVLLMAYSVAATWVDPGHFVQPPIPAWKRYL